MSTDLHKGPAPASRGGNAEAQRRAHLATLRRNLAASRAIAARRRRDVRFSILPLDNFQIVNAAALAASALALCVVLLDPWLTVWHATLPAGLVEFFGVVTDLGKSNWILVGTGLFFIATLLLDASALSPRLRARRAIRAVTAGYVFVAVAVPGIIANFTKYFLGRARPKHFDDSGTFSFDFWSGDASWASFPSGHATTASALGIALALVFPRLRWLFLCFGFWIAVSRLFTRAHYPSDVLAGCLLGGGAAWLIARAFARWRLVFGFDDTGRLIRRRGASGRLM